jgi:hypothetical protein
MKKGIWFFRPKKQIAHYYRIRCSSVAMSLCEGATVLTSDLEAHAESLEVGLEDPAPRAHYCLRCEEIRAVDMQLEDRR